MNATVYRWKTGLDFAGRFDNRGDDGATTLDAARSALRGAASDFSTPILDREGTDLYGRFRRYTARRCGREIAVVYVRPPTGYTTFPEGC
jgi:hypothetical protein